MPTPRALAPIFANGMVIGWTCRGCEWTFQVKQPRPLDSYGEEAQKLVEGAFNIHTCETWTTAHGIVLQPEED